MLTQKSAFCTQKFSESEREKSAISPELWAANTRPVSPNDTDGETGLPLPYSLLLYAGGGFSRFSHSYKNSLDGKWGHLRAGGIWFPGYKQGDVAWGVFKPLTFRSLDGQKIKYETPPGTSAGLFLPVIPGVGPTGDRFDWWRTAAASGLPLIITEGCKKALSVVSAGFPGVALPGVTMGYRKGNCPGFENDRHLIPELVEVLALGWKDIYIAFDQDPKPKTQKSVGAAARRLRGLIQEQIGSTGRCRLMSWHPRLGKGIDDYLVGGGSIPELIKDSDHFLLGQVKSRLMLPRFSSVVLDPYLPDDMALPVYRLIAIKSPKGTGKTQLMVKWHKQIEGLTILLSHRIQLGENLAARFRLPFNNSMTEDDRCYAKHLGFGCCVHSLFARSKMNWEDGEWLDGCTVFIDECEQFLLNLFVSDDLKRNRAEVLGNFLRLLRRAARVIIADADLSTLSIDFFQHALGIGDDDCFILEGQKPSAPKSSGVGVKSYSVSKKYSVTSDPEQLLCGIYARLKRGERGMILTGAKEEKSRYSASGIAKLCRDKFPGLKILLLDSYTVAAPGEAQGFIAKGFPGIRDYDLVIASPVVETGIDLHPDKLGIKWHFVAGIGFGTQTPQQFCQGLARYRGDCPRLISVPRVAAGCFFRLGSEIWPGAVSVNLGDFFQDLAMPDWGLFAGVLPTYASLIANGNLGRKCYRAAIEHLLTADGYQPTDFEEVQMEGMKLKDELAAIRDVAVAEEVTGVDSSGDISATEAKLIAESPSRSRAEASQLKRYQIKRRYGAVSRALILADLEGAFPSLRLHYLCCLGAAVQPLGATSQVFLPDLLSDRRRQLQVDAIKALPVFSLLGGGSFLGSDDWLKQLAAVDSRSFQLVFAVSLKPSNNSGLTRLRVIAARLGFEIKSFRRRLSPTKVERYYYAVLKWPDVDRAALWDYWATCPSAADLGGKPYGLDQFSNSLG